MAFADSSRQSHALQIIFEFKAADVEAGKEQLIRYLSSEPIAKMGYWTNGAQSIAVYKRHSADWVEVENAPLPAPSDDLTQAPDLPPVWGSLQDPSEAELSAVLRRILATVVTQDTSVNRREDQLREILHILLVKLESDALFSRSGRRDEPVSFRLYGGEANRVAATAQKIRSDFADYFSRQRTRVFLPHDRPELLFSDQTIYSVVAELWPYRVFGDEIDLLSKAFQILRSAALKSGEGQYLTPLRVVRSAVMALDITSEDKVIDPACGTGGFLSEALRQVAKNEFGDDDYNLVKWANESLYGIDKDDIGVKLTKAMMMAMKDGSTHVLLGDAVRPQLWQTSYTRLRDELGQNTDPFILEQFTVVVTNPPFGESLKVSAADCRAGKFSISAAASRRAGQFADLEIGLLYIEVAHRLLRVGGRLGILLPETYFFSKKYRWLSEWMEGRFALRGMMNIAMEAFEEFCRAKTNFYIFEKTGNGPMVPAVLGTEEGDA